MLSACSTEETGCIGGACFSLPTPACGRGISRPHKGAPATVISKLLLRPLLALPLAVLAWAGDAPPPAPSCTLVPGWSQSGPARSYQTANLFEYMDGNAEGYLIYGFRSMKGVTCRQGEISFVIDLSDMGDADGAYGIFSADRDPALPTDKFGMAGQVAPRRAMFVKGSYLVEIAANPEGDHSTALRAWLTALDRIITGSTALPEALAWFPAEGRQSLRLVPESVLGIRLLKRGYVAQYDFGKAFVAYETSPDSANAVMQKLRARFGQVTAANVADDAFQATDQYLGRLFIFRKGRLIGGYSIKVRRPRPRRPRRHIGRPSPLAVTVGQVGNLRANCQLAQPGASPAVRLCRARRHARPAPYQHPSLLPKNRKIHQAFPRSLTYTLVWR